MEELEADDHPRNNAIQLGIEVAMLKRLGEQHPDWRRVIWQTTAIELGLSPVWQNARLAATWRTTDQIIVAECYTRVGEVTAGHSGKLARDALKFMAIDRLVPGDQNMRYLLVVPVELASLLKGNGWFPDALRLAAEIVPIALLPAERTRLGDATALHALAQSHASRVPVSA